VLNWAPTHLGVPDLPFLNWAPRDLGVPFMATRLPVHVMHGVCIQMHMCHGRVCTTVALSPVQQASYCVLCVTSFTSTALTVLVRSATQRPPEHNKCFALQDIRKNKTTGCFTTDCDGLGYQVPKVAARPTTHRSPHNSSRVRQVRLSAGLVSMPGSFTCRG